MARFTQDDLHRLLKRNPNVTIEGDSQVVRKVPNPQPERNQTKSLDQTVPREKESLQRVTVRFRGFRVRPLDPDNFAGSIKDLLDGLRHMGAIAGDEHWRIRLETDQEKVGSYKDERIEIEVIEHSSPSTV